MSATHWAMEVSERQEDIFAVDQESPLAPPLPWRKKSNSVTYNSTFVHLYMSNCLSNILPMRKKYNTSITYSLSKILSN